MKKFEDSINMMELLTRIAPLERTLACADTDLALAILKEYLPSGTIEGYPTGKKVWTWRIPQRWSVKKAQVSANGKVLIDVKNHPLHLLNYSRPFKGRVSHEELLKHIYTEPKRPDAIPYMFEFYEPHWGFCLPHSQKNILNSEYYDVEVDTYFEDGNLNVFYDFLPGNNKETFIICSNICHPTQVNDSLTGVAVGIDIMRRLKEKKERKYSYLFLSVPEQIGSIAFLSHHPEFVQNGIGGFFSEMLGTAHPIIGQRTRAGNGYFDFLMENALKQYDKDVEIVPFLKSAANDEKVLDSPGVDIPTFAIARASYPQYHTSEDNMSLIENKYLQECRDVLQVVIDDMENDYIPCLNTPGPVFLSGHGLYPNWRQDPSLLPAWLSFNDVMFAIDGKLSVLEIAKKINCDSKHVFYWCDRFHEKGLLSKIEFIVKRNKFTRLTGMENN